MKKFLIALFISLFFVWTSYGDYCDQSFPVKKLRYWQAYVFNDTVTNDSWAPIQIKNFWLDFNARWNFWTFVNERTGQTLNTSKDNLLSHYADWVLKQNKIIYPGNNDVAVYTHRYEVVWIPATANKNGTKSKYTESDRNLYDLFLVYRMRYNDIINWQVSSTLKEHTECQPYNISWCGDGIYDKEFNETCDPNDPNKTNWWNGWCSQECKPVVKTPTCDGLTATPTTGTGKLTSTFTCNTTNATTTKIEIKDSTGKVINTIPGKSWTYTFSNVWSYSATCYADNKTSPSCTVPVITVKEEKPNSECVSLETSSTPKVWEESTFTCNGLNTNNYKIKIVNWTWTVIKEIFWKTGTYKFETEGSYVASCYVDNKTTTQETCVKPISVTNPIVPKINVDKTDNNPEDLDKNVWNDTQTIYEEGKAVFKITVKNNWTEDLKDIYLVDDVLESSVDAPSCDRTIDQVNTILQWKFGRTYLKPNESFDYTCERKSISWDPEIYTNKILVRGTWKTSGKPVEDDDPTKVNRTKEPKINVDKTDKNKADYDWVEENDTQTIDKNWTAVFKITTTNNWSEDLKNVSLKDDVLNTTVDAPNCDKSVEEVNEILKTIWNKDEIFNIWESFSYTCERASVETDIFPYTNKITVTWIWITSGIVVSDDDPTIVRTKDNWGSTSNRCISLTVDKTSGSSSFTSNFECKWTGNNFKIIVKKQPNQDILKTISWATWSYTFDAIWTYTVECFNNDISSNECKSTVTVTWGGTPPPTPTDNWGGTPPNNWGWNNWGGGWNNSYCWDGKLDRPNSKWEYEECDLWTNNGKNNSWCSATCTLKEPVTIPGEKYFDFGWKTIKVIWEGTNPYKVYENKTGIIPSFSNVSKKSEIYINQLCVTNISKFNNWTSFNTFTECDTVDTVVWPNQTIQVSSYTLNKLKKYVAKEVSVRKDFVDNVFVTFIRTHPGGSSGNLPFENSKFYSSDTNFTVRVAKWTISTTWGWVSYVATKDEDKISNISEVTKDVTWAINTNKNFVWTWLSTFLTSYANSLLSSEVVNTAEKDSIKTTNNTKTSITTVTWTVIGLDSSNDIKEYNWITWAYIIKNKNLEINSEINSIWNNWPRTYIIEGWDLIISKNINYSDNIAFVVKWWNIIIDKDVTQINGTYISIKYGTNWGEIKAKDKSAKQLVVNGSLYGNTSDLVSKRTYMKVNDNGQLDVWTIVSFGSSVFRKPAPLVSTFIDEYLKSTKVAQ